MVGGVILSQIPPKSNSSRGTGYSTKRFYCDIQTTTKLAFKPANQQAFCDIPGAINP